MCGESSPRTRTAGPSSRSRCYWESGTGRGSNPCGQPLRRSLARPDDHDPGSAREGVADHRQLTQRYRASAGRSVSAAPCISSHTGDRWCRTRERRRHQKAPASRRAAASPRRRATSTRAPASRESSLSVSARSDGSQTAVTTSAVVASTHSTTSGGKSSATQAPSRSTVIERSSAANRGRAATRATFFATASDAPTVLPCGPRRAPHRSGGLRHPDRGGTGSITGRGREAASPPRRARRRWHWPRAAAPRHRERPVPRRRGLP